MPPCASNEALLEPATRESYHEAIAALAGSPFPFLVGGAYAFGCYTGITRDTKDFDVFVHPRNVDDILRTLADAGYTTELTDPVWLAKAFHGDDLIDVIFSSGNGIARVDDEWFQYAVPGNLLGIPIQLIPIEEMIWSKSFVMTRERYDGADIAHLLRIHAESLDWQRLLRRFGPDWRILYVNLILFGYIYPSERDRIPKWVMQELTRHLESDIHSPPLPEKICRGTLLSNTQYQIDIEEWGYLDATQLRHPD